MIRLTINDQEIELERPVTVLEAARMAGIRIPTLCYFEGLRPFGGCRLCLVEVEKLPKLQTSCTLMAADGMVVRTETEQIRVARKAMLEFLLINHPLDCPVCDKAGECVLQDLVAEYGPDAGRFTEGKRRHPENFDDPIIVRNMERCVLCTRCTRMCDDLQGAYAISVTGRGSHSFVEPFSGGRYNCEYCGNCLTVCPVGAIMSRLHRHSYRPWFVEREVETVCGHCGVGCSMVLQMRENTIIRTIPRFGLGLNNGLLCVRGRFGYDFVESGERLDTPLLRKDGELRPVSWDEALDHVAMKLKEIKESHGPASIGAIASGRCTNEDNYMLQKLIRFVIGSNNIDSVARNFYAPAVMYLEGIFGQGITANLIPGIANSDGVFVIGGDPTKINPILGLQIRTAHRKGGKVITIGPPGGLSRFVDYRMAPGLGGQEALLSAIVGRLKKEKTLRGENPRVEELLNKLKIPVSEDLTALGIEEETVSRVAADLAGMDTPVVVIGPDISLTPRPSKMLFLAGAIAYLINARIFVLSEKPNFQGLIDMGCLPEMLPGARPIGFEMFRHKVEEVTGMKVPDEKGLSLYRMIDEALEGKLKALYIMGENPLFNMPDTRKVERALQKLDFLVVQDIFLSETAKIADVVLPAASWSEKEGTFVNLERRIQKLGSGRNLKGTLADWEILAQIVSRLGVKTDYTGSESVWNEITRISQLHTGLSYREIEEGNAIFPYHGEPLRGVEPGFEVESLESLPPEGKGEFTISQDRILYHSGTTSRRSKALMSIYPEARLTLSEETARRLEIQEGQTVSIRTEYGFVTLRAEIDNEIPDGTVRLSNIFEEGNFMELVGYSTDGYTGIVKPGFESFTIEGRGD